MSEPVIIETHDLSRVYKTYRKPEGLWNSVKGFFSRQYEERQALKPTTLTIGKGEVVGLVGSNGAGKTTFLKLLSGLIAPSSGHARVLGEDPWRRSYHLLRRISILLGQKNQLWWDLAPMDSYGLLAKIYDVPEDEAKRRVKELSELLQCDNLLHIQLRRLSLGERMKMEIIGSLLHRPEVLFLDEPTIGLDIVAQTVIREFLDRYVKLYQPTIILTSHYMDDISRLANRLLLISQGQIVYDGTVNDFTNKTQYRNKILLKLSEPLREPLEIENHLLPAGQHLLEVEVSAKKIGELVSKVAQRTAIEDLKIEVTDFEDVIHEFLKEDHRGRAPRHTQPV